MNSLDLIEKRIRELEEGRYSAAQLPDAMQEHKRLLEVRGYLQAIEENEPHTPFSELDLLMMELEGEEKRHDVPEINIESFIDDVIFHDPATIVKWKDGTKTIVKCQKKKGKAERFDPEKGLAMAIIKRICGNTGYYNELFKIHKG